MQDICLCLSTWSLDIEEFLFCKYFLIMVLPGWPPQNVKVVPFSIKVANISRILSKYSQHHMFPNTLGPQYG